MQWLLSLPNSRTHFPHPKNAKLCVAWQWFCGNTRFLWEIQSPVTTDEVIGLHEYFKFIEEKWACEWRLCEKFNAVVTCEIKFVQNYFSLRRVETCLKLFQKFISEAYCSSRIFSNVFNVAEIFFWNNFNGWNNFISVSDVVTCEIIKNT